MAGETAELQLRNFILYQRAVLEDLALLNPMSRNYALLADQLFRDLGLPVAELNKGELQRFVALVTREFNELNLDNEATLRDEVEDYAVLAYQGQAQAFTVAGYTVTMIEPERLTVAARNGFVEGHTLTRHLKDLGRTLVTRTNGTIRDGWVRGESNETLLRDIRGDRVMRVPAGSTTGRRKAFYRIKGSHVGVWRSQAEAVVRTAANTYATQARELFAERNADLIRTVLWVSVLDNRTTLICMGLDGRTWPYGSDHPVPPQHWNCRSSLVYLTEADEVDDFYTRASRVPKSQREFDQLSDFRQTDTQRRSRQARTRGRQVTTPSFEAFLRRLPKTTTSSNRYLKDLFGSQAAVDAFRRGDLHLRDLVRVRGGAVTALTKADLRRKFERKSPPPFPRSEL